MRRDRDMSGAVFVVAVLLALFAVGVAQGHIDYQSGQLGSCAAGALCTPVGVTSFRLPNAATTEYAEMKWDTNLFYLQTVANGGTQRIGVLNVGTGLYLQTAGVSRVVVGADGIVPGSATDTYNVGQSGTNAFANAYLTRSIQGSKSKALTDAGAAVSIERVAVPTNGYVGQFTSFTANSTDGTDRLTTTGLVSWAAADTAGTVTCGTPAVVGLSTAYKRANTLVCTFTTAVSTTNCDLQVTCTDNLAGVQTVSIEHFIVSMPSPNTYTPQ